MRFSTLTGRGFVANVAARLSAVADGARLLPQVASRRDVEEAS